MKIQAGFHVTGDTRGDTIGLTPAEVAEERRAAGTPVNGKQRIRGPRKPPVQNPFDEILRALGLLERVQTVCKEHGVAVFEIGGGARTKRLHTVRKKTYQMLRDLGWSSVDIGRLFNKDHSTILSALK